jgi:ubiquinone/menaquinone biosynthesis C-methylase UbiE
MNSPIGAQEYRAKATYSGEVARDYDKKRFSKRFGRWIDKREKLSVTRALGRIPAGSSLLDMPCGTGRITEHLLNLGYKVSGADISRDMIELGRAKLEKYANFAGFHVVDAEDTKLPAASFDCVTSIRLMGHLPRDVKVRILKEMSRISREYLVIAFYETNFLRSLKWFLRYGSLQSSNRSWYPITHSDLRRLLEECGLEVVAREPAFIVSDAITYLLRKKTVGG